MDNFDITSLFYNNNFNYGILPFNNFCNFSNIFWNNIPGLNQPFCAFNWNNTPNWSNIPLYNQSFGAFTYNNISLFSNSTQNSSNNKAIDTVTKTNTNLSTSKVTQQNTTTYKIGKFNLDYWKNHGYDHEKGKALALDAAKVTKGTPGQCVGYTRKTINRVYGTNFQNAGAAQYFGTKILSSPQLKNKFRKVSMGEVEKYGIPDGAVVLWAGGSPGFTKGKALLYGHGGICYQGKVYSNYVESRHLGTCKEIWIPIT